MRCTHKQLTINCITQIRFSNDKTPYKTNFSASFSRSGRKGIFAGCESIPYKPSLTTSGFFTKRLSCPTDHMYVSFSSKQFLRHSWVNGNLNGSHGTRPLHPDPVRNYWVSWASFNSVTNENTSASHSVKPGGGSFFAAGTWCPGKNEIQTIRYLQTHSWSRNCSILLTFSLSEPTNIEIDRIFFETPVHSVLPYPRRSSWSCMERRNHIRRGRSEISLGARTNWKPRRRVLQGITSRGPSRLFSQNPWLKKS